MPIDPQPAPVIVDGHPSVVANSIQVEIHGETLTRESGAEEAAISAAFTVVDHFLQRLRAIASAPFVRAVRSVGSHWYLEYLNDDGLEFEADPQGRLVRRRLSSQFRIPSMTVLEPGGVWDSTLELPEDYVLPPWESLLLDARLLLESERVAPEVGPAIVLAASAIETRIDDALRTHAERHGDPSLALWTWLTNRDQWWQAPSFAQKLSTILVALTQRSLKNDEVLWVAFRELSQARNKYVHEGTATIGGEQVTPQRAGALLAKTRAVLDWIEDGLPAENRRPRYERQHEIQVGVPLFDRGPREGGEEEDPAGGPRTED